MNSNRKKLKEGNKRSRGKLLAKGFQEDKEMDPKMYQHGSNH